MVVAEVSNSRKRAPARQSMVAKRLKLANEAALNLTLSEPLRSDSPVDSSKWFCSCHENN